MLHLVWVGGLIGLLAALFAMFLEIGCAREFGMRAALIWLLLLAGLAGRDFPSSLRARIDWHRLTDRLGRDCSSGEDRHALGFSRARYRRGRIHQAVKVSEPIEADAMATRIPGALSSLASGWLAQLSTCSCWRLAWSAFTSLRRSSRLVETGELPRRCACWPIRWESPDASASASATAWPCRS